MRSGGETRAPIDRPETMARIPSSLPLALVGAGFLAAFALAQHRTEPQTGPKTEPEASFLFSDFKGRLAPDERRALIVAKAMWEAGAGTEFTKEPQDFAVRRVDEAWLVTVCDKRAGKGEILDGCAFFAFDSFDGGFFTSSLINPPTDDFIRKAQKHHRGGRTKDR